MFSNIRPNFSFGKLLRVFVFMVAFSLFVAVYYLLTSESFSLKIFNSNKLNVSKSNIMQNSYSETDDSLDGFRASYIFKEVNDTDMYSYYNVCIEERQPPVSHYSSWQTFQETQRIVIYRGYERSSAGRNASFERRNISVAGSPESMFKHWELFFSNASIPSSHKLLPTTAFFVSESIPGNLYHAWNDLFLRLFSVVRDANRLHPGMRNQILYRNPRSHVNLSDPVCKFCRRARYDFLQDTLHTTKKYFLFYESPTNTCYSSAVFGTRYSGSRRRDAIDYVLKELKLSYRPSSKNKNVIFVKRQYRRILNIHHIANETKRIGFKNVRVVKLESMTVLEQLRTIVATDILIGVQGAALQWATFMQPGSTVIEISWPKKYWVSGFWFLPTYELKFVKFETDEVFANWKEYEKHWRKVNSEAERTRMLNSKPASAHDNIWKYADVTLNVKKFNVVMKGLL